MTSTRLAGLLCLLFGLLATSSAMAVDTRDTRLLTLPAVSESNIAFVYAEDLWICDLDGANVRRLTSHKGSEINPRFSPDGKLLAFSAQYDGNIDVYLLPVSGGAPERLTWHPGADTVLDFSPDGSRILFSSQRSVFTNRYLQLFEVPIKGGNPEPVPIPHAFKATYSPDGKKIAYVPVFEAFGQWKNYRGGTTSRIWLYDRGDHSTMEIPQPEGRCNDTDPMWVGDRIYFRSDRNGEFNLHSFDLGRQRMEQLTHHEDFPVLSASASATRIAYEQAGYLHIFDPARSSAARLVIGVASDLSETRPRYVTGDRWIRSASPSPSGARVAVEFRGDVVTVPRKKGSPRTVTATSGANERNPVWSPDGRWIAYFSDQSGEYELHIVRQDDPGDRKTFKLDGCGSYDALTWSPDSGKLSYSDNSWSLYWLAVDTGDIKKISTEPVYGPVKTLSHSWSPDSEWIAYTRITPTYFQRIWIYSLAGDRSSPVTDGLSDVGEPVFDPTGKYLYMTASTDSGPVRQWFAMSNADMEMTNSLYIAVLSADDPSPLLAESDEEKIDEEAEGEKKADDADDTGDAGNASPEGSVKGEKGQGHREDAASKPEVKIDFEGIENRILALPLESGLHSNLGATEGYLYYLRAPGRGRLFGGPAAAELLRFDLAKRKEEKITGGVTGFSLTFDGKKILLGLVGGGLSLVDAGPAVDSAAGRLPTDKIQVRIEPLAEWRQMYDEAWRINRDWFYVENMHGADWPAMRDKYAVFLPHLAVRSDLNRVIQWMCSELAVGHHRVGGGDRLEPTESIPGGLLGCDFTVDAERYRFRRIFSGLNWNPELRSPLTEPGVDVKEGEYLLAVEGTELRTPDNVYRLFENTAGKRIRITVGPQPDGTGSREVHVVPLDDEYALRNRDWVEGNIRKVHEATQGRCAYVYLPNTTSMGHTYFKRYFFPQADKEAIIVDERFNGGGQVADYTIDILSRPEICAWATRYGKEFKTPLSSIQGPKVMLINELAGSGGDLLPWMFRKLGLGTLVGRRTWGGLVGTLGFPTLLDGGVVTAPNLGFFAEEEGFGVENVGVPPDIDVEQTPAAVIAGGDPQLERAIAVILEKLAESPPHTLERPADPIRVRR